MGTDSKKARFSRFHESVGKAEYAPDFLDSMIRVMADPDRCIEERVLAWAKYRAWGNQNEFAIHIYSENGDPPRETPLGQQDCARELAWLEAGMEPEWLDAPLDLLKAEFAEVGLHPPDKSVVSRGFHANEISGTIAPKTGHKVVPVVSPPSLVLPRNSQESTTFQKFTEWAKVAYSREFQEREVVRSRKKELDKFFVVKYKDWLKSLTPETPAALPIIPIIPIIQETAAASDLVVIPEEPEPLPETPPPPFPECPTEHKNGNSAGTETGNLPEANRKSTGSEPEIYRKPAEQEPAPVQVEPFVEAVQAKFPQNPPTTSQCGRALATLCHEKLPLDGFIQYLTPERMAKIHHGGVIDELVQGYRAEAASKAKAPPGCPYCQCDRMRGANCAACNRTREQAARDAVAREARKAAGQGTRGG